MSYNLFKQSSISDTKRAPLLYMNAVKSIKIETTTFDQCYSNNLMELNEANLIKLTTIVVTNMHVSDYD